MTNFIEISKCGKFIMSENKIYSVERNRSYNIKDLGIGFWIHLMKENSLRVIEQNINNISKINKLLNETVFKFSNLFDDQSLIIEFHKTNGGLILTEGFSLNSYKTTIENSWEFFNSYLIKNELISEQDSWLDRAWNKTKEYAGKAWDKTKEYAGKAYEKVKSAVSWIKEKGVSWFFESMRAALFSWGGVAVQTFLATVGSAAFGIGPAINFVTWAAMLCYDIYLGISKGEWNWVYIIIDILGAFTAGPGAKIAHGIFKAAGLLGKGAMGGLTNIVKKLGATSGGKKLAGLVQQVVGGIGTLLGYVTQAAKWLGDKLGIKFISQSATNIKNKISETVTNLSKSFKSTGAGKIAQQTGKAISNTGKKVKSVGQTYKNLPVGVKATVGAAGMGGLTYGLNAYSGSDNTAFAGAFSKEFMTPEQKQAEDIKQLSSMKGEFPDEDFPPS
jgi:hypothetical protein